MPLVPGRQIAAATTYGCGARLRAVALVIWFLSRQCGLAGYYIISNDSNAFRSDASLPDDVELCLILLDWWRSRKVQQYVDVKRVRIVAVKKFAL